MTKVLRHPSRFYRNRSHAESEAREQAAAKGYPFAVIKVGTRYTTRSEHRALSWCAAYRLGRFDVPEIVATITPEV